ncbi:hypothetical protein [Zymobacter palmae]|uniref:ABC-type amino acid transport/signal n=1 Tax=Zymobacter palmae TaxID=33074 RepID=A0A348HB61_9GAMM|nr:hypothetical protein [Zymobacter palmae]BBG28863.1 ABC-type amino acid transport/signal [Zymobacter palmae]
MHSTPHVLDRRDRERTHHAIRHTLFQIYLLMVVPVTCLLAMTYFRTYLEWISRNELNGSPLMVSVQILSLMYIVASVICGLGVLFHQPWAQKVTQNFLLLSVLYPLSIYLLQMKILHWHLHSPFIGFVWVLVPALVNCAIWTMHARSEHHMQIDYCLECRKQRRAQEAH